MPHSLVDLVVDRVDFVDEGACSAAFIELYKRKENDKTMDVSEILAKMKPEHAAVIQQELDAREADLAKAREEVTGLTSQLETIKKASKFCECDGEEDEEGCCKACGMPKKKSAAFDETETLKSMPAAAREMFQKMRADKEAAEEQVRKNAEEKLEAVAKAKAASLKALPIEQGQLANILKGCSDEVFDLLVKANTAIEAGLLTEVGKSTSNGAAVTTDAWGKIEQAAAEIARRDAITKEKAVGKAISENPKLYEEYINGGAN